MPGQSVLVHVAASSLAPITGLSLTIAGQPLTLDSQGRATYTPQAPGRIAVTATATDGDGLVGQYATVLKVRDPNDQAAPVVAFEPAAGQCAADRRGGHRRHDQRHEPRHLGARPRPDRLVRRSRRWPAAHAPVSAGDSGHLRPDRAGQRALRPPPDRHRHRRAHQPDDDRGRGRQHDQADPVSAHRDRPVGGPGRLGVQPGPLVRLADGGPVGHVRLRLAAGQPGHGHPDDGRCPPATSRPASTTRSGSARGST